MWKSGTLRGKKPQRRSSRYKNGGSNRVSQQNTDIPAALILHHIIPAPCHLVPFSLLALINFLNNQKWALSTRYVGDVEHSTTYTGTIHAIKLNR
jgi:hypothetical protein